MSISCVYLCTIGGARNGFSRVYAQVCKATPLVSRTNIRLHPTATRSCGVCTLQRHICNLVTVNRQSFSRCLLQRYEQRMCYLEYIQLRHKSKARKGRISGEITDEDSDSEDESVIEDDDPAVEEDSDAPAVYKDRKAHSLRADNLVNKGLGLTNSETEQYFYQSRFVYNGKILLKKARKLEVGEHIDVITERDGRQSKLMVRRVKVIAVGKNTTRSGKPMVTIRTWRAAFEIDTPVDLQKS